MTVREEREGTSVARRFDVATRGTVEQGGAIALDVTRVEYERRNGRGEVSTLTTANVSAPADRSAADAATTRLLEALRAAPIRLALDGTNGVVSFEGIDRAFDAAVAGDPSLAAERASLRDVCSDDGWRRGLVAAGLGPVPGDDGRREARVRVPGFGETTMRLAGSVGVDDGGKRAFRCEGRLAADAAFEGEPGAAPAVAGVADVAGVVGRATTSYAALGGLPTKGEWTLTIPFAAGRSVSTTTTFTLVQR